MGYGKENMAFDSAWDNAHLARTYSLVERDKNHPSVIIWSLGNESSNGDVFRKTYNWIKGRDNSRPVQYEQAKEGKATDIVCPMYANIDEINKYAHKSDIYRPLILCEYSHAMLAPWTVDAEKFGQFYIAIFDEWIRKDVGKYYVQLFDAALAGTVGEVPGVCIFAETCGHAFSVPGGTQLSQSIVRRYEGFLQCLFRPYFRSV